MRIGIDEAGKGPVLGPMFVAGVRVDGQLPDGVCDSKQLDNDSINELASDLRSKPSVEVDMVKLSSSDIDLCKSINELILQSVIQLIQSLGNSTETVIIDGVSKDIEQYKTRIEEELEDDYTIVVEHRADEAYDVVGAASIIAKYHREEEMNRIGGSYEADIGSGYPSDEKTIQFIKEYLKSGGDFPNCTRESWDTARRIKAETEQTGLTDF